MIVVHPKNKHFSYRIYISNSFKDFYNIFSEYIINKNKTFIVTDDRVENIYTSLIEELKVKLNGKVFSIKHGEGNKNYSTISEIYKFLLENNCDRDSVLVALGGGVVGDMVGFVAATYMRGIDYVNIPTTLISQVDSSVGGKVGYNFLDVKNPIGCFYDPALVYIASEFLNTLSKKELLNGMGEVIKYGLIQDNNFIGFIENNLQTFMNLEDYTLNYIIHNCIEFKSKVISEDYKDKGIRNILNFGHTVGHGLEASSKYTLTHGVAVALGMLVSMKLSERKFDLSNESYFKIENIYKKLGLPTKHKVDNFPSFLYAINHDKKNSKDINFVLIKRIGECEIKVPVSEEELIWALKNSILED